MSTEQIDILADIDRNNFLNSHIVSSHVYFDAANAKYRLPVKFPEGISQVLVPRNGFQANFWGSEGLVRACGAAWASGRIGYPAPREDAPETGRADVFGDGGVMRRHGQSGN